MKILYILYEATKYRRQCRLEYVKFLKQIVYNRGLNVLWVSVCTHGRVSGPSSLLDQEVIAPCGTSVPCQLRPEVRRHGRGVLWAGGNHCMTGCLEGPLASPAFAQSWSQTATDGAWSSNTALQAAVTDHDVYAF